MRQGFFGIQIPGNYPLHLLAGESSQSRKHPGHKSAKYEP